MRQLLLIAAAMAAAIPAYAATAPEAVIPLSLIHGKLFTIEATVSGRSGQYLFDTGEGITMITPSVAAAAHCVPWGNVTGFRMLGDRMDLPRCDNIVFTLPGGQRTAPETIVFDLGSMDPSAAQLQGSIGLDLFAGHAVTIELAAHRVIVESPASLADRIRTATSIPIRLVRDAEGAALSVDIGVTTKRGLAWMELDTGNDSPTIVVSQSVAPLLGLDATSKPPKNAPSQPVTLPLAPGLNIAGFARVFPGMIMDGNIALKFLEGWNITLDLQASKGWLAPGRK
jgi:hypothetical protein